MTPCYCFIVTKPLQLLVATAIADQLADEVEKHLVIVDAFENSEEVYSRAETAMKSVFTRVLYAGQSDAYRVGFDGRYQRVYIDSDVGVRKFFVLLAGKWRNRQTSIFVYEEGIGTYRADIYPRYKAAVLGSLGVGAHFGGCSLTDGILLYRPARYRAEVKTRPDKVEKIELSVSSVIEKYREEFEFIFRIETATADLIATHQAKSCFVYLTSWEVNDAVLGRLAQHVGPKYVKPHPHVTNHRWPDDDYIVVPGDIPAELLLEVLGKYFERVLVYHHGSSTMMYVSSTNVEFMRV